MARPLFLGDHFQTLIALIILVAQDSLDSTPVAAWGPPPPKSYQERLSRTRRLHVAYTPLTLLVLRVNYAIIINNHVVKLYRPSYSSRSILGCISASMRSKTSHPNMTYTASTPAHYLASGR